MIDLCSPSHLLALGSPRPLWSSLREGHHDQPPSDSATTPCAVVEIVVSSSPSTISLAALGRGGGRLEEESKADDDDDFQHHMVSSSSMMMEKVPSLVMLTTHTTETAEESKEQEEPGEAMIGSFRVLFDDDRIASSSDADTTTKNAMQKVPSLASIQIRKVPSLSAITTQVGDLTNDFENILVQVTSPQATTTAAATPTNNLHTVIHVGRMLEAFRSMETVMRNAGMTLSANDMANNISKVENLYRTVPVGDLQYQQDDMMALLSYEIETGIHYNSKWTQQLQLNDNSAAMGLLWLGRNLQYQYDMYRFMLEDNNKDPMEAALLSFQQNLQPHLNWAVSKLVQAGISNFTPSKQCIFFSMVGGFDTSHCSPEQCSASKRDVRRMMDQWKPLLEIWKDIFVQLNLGTI